MKFVCGYFESSLLTNLYLEIFIPFFVLEVFLESHIHHFLPNLFLNYPYTSIFSHYFSRVYAIYLFQPGCVELIGIEAEAGHEELDSRSMKCFETCSSTFEDLFHNSIWSLSNRSYLWDRPVSTLLFFFKWSVSICLLHLVYFVVKSCLHSKQHREIWYILCTNRNTSISFISIDCNIVILWKIYLRIMEACCWKIKFTDQLVIDIRFGVSFVAIMHLPVLDRDWAVSIDVWELFRCIVDPFTLSSLLSSPFATASCQCPPRRRSRPGYALCSRSNLSPSSVSHRFSPDLFLKVTYLRFAPSKTPDSWVIRHRIVCTDADQRSASPSDLWSEELWNVEMRSCLQSDTQPPDQINYTMIGVKALSKSQSHHNEIVHLLVCYHCIIHSKLV